MEKDQVAELRKSIAKNGRYSPPAKFSISFRPDECTKDWMVRNGIDEKGLLSAAYTQLVQYSVVSLVISVILAFLVPYPMNLMIMFCLLLFPVLTAFSILNAPVRLSGEEQMAMLAESPTVVGMISMSMHLSPSLERAAAYAARNGEGALTFRLRHVMWDAATGWSGGVSDGIGRVAASLGETNRNLRQALQMISTAASESSRVGLERLLDRANELAVAGVKERLDRYITSLSFPTMVLFAFGVLLPVMLFSMVPLLTIRVALGSDIVEPPLGTLQIAFLMLVMFPSCAFLYARSTLSKHPLRRKERTELPRRDAIIFLTLLVFGGAIGSVLPFGQPYAALLCCIIPGSIWACRTFGKSHREEKRRPQQEGEFSSALYQVGNQLLSGSSLEASLQTAAQMRRSTHFSRFVAGVMHQLRTSGIPLSTSMQSNELLRQTTPLVRNAFITVAEAAEIDPEAAGRTAVNLARYIWELRESERVGKERMRSVVDMMSYTTMLFAPIVLAVTSGLYQVVSSIAPMGDSTALIWIGGIYVAELCLVVGYFNQNLMGQASPRDLIYGFGRTAPIAMTAFVIASIIAQEGMGSIF
ncbi:MAG: hypothetical protein A4E32_01628 [Methanomassiliicoccales archaeon PtaU1.Bin124]|nr:MAG: hypothetical protein A4E32_01628 [Methanomassiliicoccales archaeon PtaU1.Bin124]